MKESENEILTHTGVHYFYNKWKKDEETLVKAKLVK